MNAVFGRLAILLFLEGSLAACGRKVSSSRAHEPLPTPAASSTLTATSSTAPNPTTNFTEVAQQIGNAVVIVTVFNEGGHLSANGHGFFVSDDGKFVADRSVMADGVNAVAKAANGAIYNVSGALAQMPAQNLVLFKADAAHVSFITPSSSAIPEIGGDVAVVLSPVERAHQLVLEEKINAHFTDQAGEWFDVTPALPKAATGAPVVNRRGELVGIVTLRGDSNNACVIRSANSANALLAQIPPNMIANWQTPTRPSSSPTAPSFATKSPTPVKIPVRGSKLLFAPSPQYPQEIRRSHSSVRGSGSFRIVFDSQGNATSVQTVRSTGNPLLDEAAVSALHAWRAQPGQGWSLVVPITFQP
jgi:TonB family protein